MIGQALVLLWKTIFPPLLRIAWRGDQSRGGKYSVKSAYSDLHKKRRILDYITCNSIWKGTALKKNHVVLQIIQPRCLKALIRMKKFRADILILLPPNMRILCKKNEETLFLHCEFRTRAWEHFGSLFNLIWCIPWYVKVWMVESLRGRGLKDKVSMLWSNLSKAICGQPGRREITEYFQIVILLSIFVILFILQLLIGVANTIFCNYTPLTLSILFPGPLDCSLFSQKNEVVLMFLINKKI